jgi:hypothetical protein
VVPERAKAARSAAGEETDHRSAGPTALGPAAAGPAADAVLGLQRTVGNAAVNAMLDPPSPAPEDGSSVREVLRSEGRPLPTALRADMEQRLGADFSDVRVHTSAAATHSAASVGAAAYTSGSHVVLGAGAGDRHTMAHELTHVIQQRQGPVSGTDTGDGLAVSDPGDRFERAAEANAERALAGRQATPTDVADGSGAGGQRPEAAALQRMTPQELHQEPPGPAVKVRGPRRSAAGDKARVKINDRTEWRDLEQLYQFRFGQAPEKQRIEFGTDPNTMREFGPPGTGGALTRRLRDALGGGFGDAPDPMLEQVGRNDPTTAGYWQQQDQRDQQLATDAGTRAADYQNAGGAEDAQAVNDAAAGALRGMPQDAIDGVATLLSGNEGLVIGGGHGTEPFYEWAITHMHRLHGNGVRTLYLESLRDDAHQGLVDEYLRTPDATMRPELANYCATYQDRWHVDLAGLLSAARDAGIRVRGASGRPARREGGDNHRRAVMLNTYAEQAVRQDRATQAGQPGGSGKYLMQIGASHVGGHTNTGAASQVGSVALPNQFPGVDELLGVPGVSLEESYDGGRHLRTIQPPRGRPG